MSAEERMAKAVKEISLVCERYEVNDREMVGVMSFIMALIARTHLFPNEEQSSRHDPRQFHPTSVETTHVDIVKMLMGLHTTGFRFLMMSQVFGGWFREGWEEDEKGAEDA